MPYFLYLSKTKIDTLYDGLPASCWSHTQEIEGGPKFLRIKGARTKLAGDSLTTQQKLTLVGGQIDRWESPGSLLNPQPYIRDRLMLWSIVLPGRDPSDGPGFGETVLFVGRSLYGTCLVLGGSAGHLIPPPSGPTEGFRRNSNFYYLQQEVLDFSEKWRQLTSTPEDADDVVPIETEDAFMYDSIVHIAESPQGPHGRLYMPLGYCEFLARVVRIPETTDEYWNDAPPPDAILATPLYVQHIDAQEPKQSDFRWSTSAGWDA